MLALNKCPWINSVVVLPEGSGKQGAYETGWQFTNLRQTVPSSLSIGSRIVGLMSNDIWDATIRPSKIFLVCLQHKEIRTDGKCLEERGITSLVSLATYILLCSRTIPVANKPVSTTLGPQLSPWHLSSVNLIKRCSLIYIYSTCTHASSHTHHRCREPHWLLQS